MSSEKLNFAIAAIKSGDKVTGLHLLAEIIKAEPSNEYAWIWLTTCVDDNEKKIFCLKRAVINQSQIDPVVNKALAQLVQPPLPAEKELIPDHSQEEDLTAEKPLSPDLPQEDLPSERSDHGCG